MAKVSTFRNERGGVLDSLAARVQQLYTNAQAALPADRSRLYGLYREAYLVHRAQKILIDEQDVLLAKAA